MADFTILASGNFTVTAPSKRPLLWDLQEA
jgi:hypothetical protein